MALRDLLEVLKDAVFGDDPSLLENRRKHARIQMQLPVRGQCGKVPFTGELLDVGVQGMRIGASIKLKKDQQITVSAMPGDGISGDGELRCKVVWCRKMPDEKIQAGLLYDDSRENLAKSWVHYLLLQNQVSVGERKDRRVEASYPVVLEDIDGKTVVQGHLVDLSLGGAKVRVTGSFAQDRQVFLCIKVGNSQPVRAEASVVAASVVDDSPALEDLMDPSKLIASSSDGQKRYDYSLRFIPNDVQGRALRRLIHGLIRELRKSRRPRTASVNGVKKVSRAAASRRPEGILGDAVLGHSQEAPPPEQPVPSVSKSQKIEKSKFLSRNRSHESLELSNWRPLPKWTEAGDAQESQEVTWKKRVKERSYSRSLLEGFVAEQFPDLESLRGWFHNAYGGEFALRGWMPDQVARPTFEFFSAMTPMLCGSAVVGGWRPFALGGTWQYGPGLLWTDRTSLGKMFSARRHPLQWLQNLLRRKEKIERRPLTLQERFMALLGLLSLGGPSACRSQLICAQIALNIARETGLEDLWDLNDLIMGAALKDVGEALFLVVGAPKVQRERWTLHLNGLDLDCPRIESLLQRWPDFRIPSNLVVNRYVPGSELFELLPLHPTLGQSVLEDLGFPEAVTKMARYHHEAYNGSGFPDGLSGQEIPWMARCIAVADTFAGLVIAECLPSEALERVERASGLMFDPDVVAALRSYLSSLGLTG